ncbi:unnamed protein product [Leptosia nina]|uniref:NADP-dependent oxidoreductase domain-containing protein n=1 Tax=Leptosia nina TaxID=320188 RepID=A0AAV1IYL3_9NEOP
MPPKVPNVRLNNGVQMPILGLGTYARKWETGDFRKAVECGIDVGYHHIDTASMYKNEEEVGEGIINKIKEGIVTRNDLFVTTKLWNNRHAEKDIVLTLKESLAKLKLDYVDLYLVHWPVSINDEGEDQAIDYIETWRGMEQALQLGLTKSIGVSNFNEEQLERLLATAKVKPVVNQIEINPSLTQQKLVDYCKSVDVQPVAYTPLGLLSDARPEFAHLDKINTDPRFGALAEKYGKTKAQIALRYLVQRGIVVIPKSFTKSRMEENLKIFDFELSAAEMALVDSFNLNHRCVPATAFAKHKYYPF